MNKTKDQKFYKGSTDLIFKTIFVHSDDPHRIEALLCEILKKKVKIIRFFTNDLPKNKAKEKGKNLDLLLECDNSLINVEVNTSYSLGTRVRNFNYFTSFYSQQTKRGESFDTVNQYMQININFNDPKNYTNKLFKLKIDNINIYDKNKEYDLNECYVSNFSIIDINVDNIIKQYYNQGKLKKNDYEILTILGLDKKQLEEYNIDSKVGKEIRDKIMELNTDATFYYDLTKEERDKMAHNTDKMIAKEEGFKQGIEQKTVEATINLYKNGASKDLITKSLNISLKELNNIIKDV